MRKLDYVLAKTEYGEKIMKILKDKFKLKYIIFYIGHTTIFPHKNIHKRDYSAILHLAGAHEFKNTDTIIKCWLKYPYLPRIIIGCYDNCIKNSLKKYLSEDEYNRITEQKNITFINGKIDFGDIVILKYYYAIQLCPSITEGFGHYINEARITKSLVITSNIPPMNEFVDDNSGVLINCDTILHKDNGNLLCLFNVDTLANIIIDVTKLTPSQINEYGQKAYNRYVADKKFYLKRAKQVNAYLLKKSNFSN